MLTAFLMHDVHPTPTAYTREGWGRLLNRAHTALSQSAVLLLAAAMTQTSSAVRNRTRVAPDPVVRAPAGTGSLPAVRSTDATHRTTGIKGLIRRAKWKSRLNVQVARLQRLQLLARQSGH